MFLCVVAVIPAQLLIGTTTTVTRSTNLRSLVLLTQFVVLLLMLQLTRFAIRARIAAHEVVMI